MDELISALISVGKEKNSFTNLRKLQSIIQEDMERWRDKLWITYSLNQIIEDFFSSVEGIDLSNNIELKRELEIFRKFFADLGGFIKTGDLQGQVKTVNKIIESYINVINLL